ncbi:hypothetical protein F1880_006253 [Penicillium rolfsii]|nr:hypothetical protein F1880_006253 [Penicillium rolfsii]
MLTLLYHSHYFRDPAYGRYHFPSTTAQVESRRYRPAIVLDELLPKTIGATLVVVCGLGASLDVGRAAREVTTFLWLA